MKQTGRNGGRAGTCDMELVMWNVNRSGVEAGSGDEEEAGGMAAGPAGGTATRRNLAGRRCAGGSFWPEEIRQADVWQAGTEISR